MARKAAQFTRAECGRDLAAAQELRRRHEARAAEARAVAGRVADLRAAAARLSDRYDPPPPFTLGTEGFNWYLTLHTVATNLVDRYEPLSLRVTHPDILTPYNTPRHPHTPHTRPGVE